MHTIVLVDDELPLLTLLQDLLALPGQRHVEIQEGTLGLTPELLLLGDPSLVIINPRMTGLPAEDLHDLLAAVRAASRARVLFMADLPAEELDRVVKAHGADAGIPIRNLLEDPVARLALAASRPSPVDGRPAPPPAPARPSLESLGAGDILDLEMDLDGPPAAPPAPVAASPAATLPDALLPDAQPQGPVEIPAPRAPVPPSLSRSEHSGEVLELILRELAAVPLAPGSERRFAITLDNFSDHNLWAGEGGPAGVFVASVVFPAVGAHVKVDVTFPWGGVAAFSGTVAWTRQAGAGPLGRRRKAGFAVRLDAMDDAQLGLLKRFAQLRAPILHAA